MISGTDRLLLRHMWIASYVVALLSPAVLLAMAPSKGAERTVLFGICVGFIALTGLVLQFVLPSRARSFTAPFGIGVLLRVHRSMGYVVLALVVLHIAIFVQHESRFWGWLVPLHEPLKAQLGFVALVGLVLLVATSLLRTRLRMSYEAWRVVHIVLGTVVLLGAAAHALMIRWYSAIPVLHWYTIVVAVIGLLAIGYLRVGRPFIALASLYEVTRVQTERGDATTIELQAVDHGGIAFAPGQFAWLKHSGKSYSLAEHPFSYASGAADPTRISFTVRALGDFTSRAGELVPGTPVLIDGPHGAYEPVLPDAGFVFVVAGIGITPAMSFLRTFAETGDMRPVRLLYGARQWEQITFREELEALRQQINLEITYVLSDPEPGWTGAVGQLTPERIAPLLPADAQLRNVLVCGPPRMIDATLRELRRIGIPEHHVYADRFDSV